MVKLNEHGTLSHSTCTGDGTHHVDFLCVFSHR